MNHNKVLGITVCISLSISFSIPYVRSQGRNKFKSCYNQLFTDNSFYLIPCMRLLSLYFFHEFFFFKILNKLAMNSNARCNERANEGNDPLEYRFPILFVSNAEKEKMKKNQKRRMCEC